MASKQRTNEHGTITLDQPHVTGRPISERFRSFIKEVDDHWIWFGHIGTHNQPYFYDGTHNVNAKRLLLERLYGIDLTGRKVMRNKMVCDDPLCINPEHLCLRKKGHTLRFKQKSVDLLK